MMNEAKYFDGWLAFNANIGINDCKEQLPADVLEWKRGWVAGRDDIYEEGYASFYNDSGLTSCPYSNESGEKDNAWTEGYQAAQEQDSVTGWEY